MVVLRTFIAFFVLMALFVEVCSAPIPGACISLYSLLLVIEGYWFIVFRPNTTDTTTPLGNDANQRTPVPYSHPPSVSRRRRGRCNPETRLHYHMLQKRPAPPLTRKPRVKTNKAAAPVVDTAPVVHTAPPNPHPVTRPATPVRVPAEPATPHPPPKSLVPPSVTPEAKLVPVSVPVPVPPSTHLASTNTAGGLAAAPVHAAAKSPVVLNPLAAEFKTAAKVAPPVQLPPKPPTTLNPHAALFQPGEKVHDVAIHAPLSAKLPTHPVSEVATSETGTIPAYEKPLAAPMSAKGAGTGGVPGYASVAKIGKTPNISLVINLRTSHFRHSSCEYAHHTSDRTFCSPSGSSFPSRTIAFNWHSFWRCS